VDPVASNEPWESNSRSRELLAWPQIPSFNPQSTPTPRASTINALDSHDMELDLPGPADVFPNVISTMRPDLGFVGNAISEEFDRSYSAPYQTTTVQSQYQGLHDWMSPSKLESAPSLSQSTSLSTTDITHLHQRIAELERENAELRRENHFLHLDRENDVLPHIGIRNISNDVFALQFATSQVTPTSTIEPSMSSKHSDDCTTRHPSYNLQATREPAEGPVPKSRKARVEDGYKCATCSKTFSIQRDLK
jgi:hypothetical protein